MKIYIVFLRVIQLNQNPFVKLHTTYGILFSFPFSLFPFFLPKVIPSSFCVPQRGLFLPVCLRQKKRELPLVKRRETKGKKKQANGIAFGNTLVFFFSIPPKGETAFFFFLCFCQRQTKQRQTNQRLFPYGEKQFCFFLWFFSSRGRK